MGLLLQKRDMEICEFLLEMKFCDVDLLSKKFFSDSKNEVSMAARRRVRILEKKGVLRSEYGFLESTKKVYYPTPLAHELVSSWASKIFPKPLNKVPVSLLRHDIYVTRCRLKFEESTEFNSWISEREIQRGFEFEEARDFLGTRDLPDGIAVLGSGKRVCVEVELSMKCKSRIEDRLYKYFEMMNRREAPFDHCVVLCSGHRIMNVYRELSNDFKGCFEILDINKFLEEGLYNEEV